MLRAQRPLSQAVAAVQAPVIEQADDKKPDEPALRHAPRKGFGHILFLLATYAEVIMLAEHRLTAVSGGRNIKA
jgi:hypothetical protein